MTVGINPRTLLPAFQLLANLCEQIAECIHLFSVHFYCFYFTFISRMMNIVKGFYPNKLHISICLIWHQICTYKNYKSNAIY